MEFSTFVFRIYSIPNQEIEMSESFVVSARKYRPATFNSVVGQNHITDTLKKAITSNHLAQAYLFTGPRGVGKTTCARILAKAMNCENLESDGEPCNACNSCKTFIEQRSMNIFELDAASNNSVEDIRALVEQIRFSPQAGKYKTYIIDEVHMLSAAAFNAFLKTLEEPPPYAVFILATTEKHKIIPTILSRCQINDFNRIQVKDISSYLQFIAEKENIKTEETALHIIAQKADGALRDALTIFDRIVSFTQNEITYDFVVQNLNIIDYDYFFKAIDLIQTKNIAELLLVFDELLNKGFDGQNFLMGLSEHLRNLLVSQLPNTDVLLDVPETVKNRFIEAAKKTNKSFILSALNILNQFNLSYKESKNQRLHTELALIKLAYISDAIDLVKSLEDQKKKAEPTVALPPQKETIEAKPKQEEVKTPNTTQQNSESSNLAKEESKHQEKIQPKKKNGISNFANLNTVREQLIQEESEEKAKLKQVQETPSDGIDENKKVPINQKHFQEIYSKYLDEELKNNMISLYNSLKDNPIKFPDEFSILLEFENASLEERFRKVMSRFIEFMNGHQIENFQINTTTREVTKEEKSKYLISPEDKYKHLKEKNPELENLQKNLGLSPKD